MTSLVLEIGAGDDLLINDAVIHFERKTKIVLTKHARFLFGKQIMLEANATTLLRKVYFRIQQAYVGPQHDAGGQLTLADWECDEIGDERVRALVGMAHAGEFYRALMGVRCLIREQETEA